MLLLLPLLLQPRPLLLLLLLPMPPCCRLHTCRLVLPLGGFPESSTLLLLCQGGCFRSVAAWPDYQAAIVCTHVVQGAPHCRGEEWATES